METIIEFFTTNWAIISPILVALIYLAIKITPDDNPRWQIVDTVLSFFAELLKDRSKIKDDLTGKSLSHKEIKAFEKINKSESLKEKVQDFLTSKKNK